METTILDCGHAPSPSEISTGYGEDPQGKKYCYECCADRDKEGMRRDGRITLYLSNNEVTNWPGTLRFRAYVKTGRHNIAGVRRDVWFTFEGFQWHGVQIGNNSQLCYCRKTKALA